MPLELSVIISQGVVFESEITALLDQGKLILLALNLQLGVSNSEKIHQIFFESCVNYRDFQGAIVGKENQAYYLVGQHNKKYLFLDPH